MVGGCTRHFTPQPIVKNLIYGFKMVKEDNYDTTLVSLSQNAGFQNPPPALSCFLEILISFYMSWVDESFNS